MDRPRPIRGRLTPAMLTAIATAVLGLITAFEVVSLSQVQIGAVMSAVGVAGIVLVAMGVLSAEGEVTPLEDPQLPEGTTVTTTSAGRVTGTTTV